MFLRCRDARPGAGVFVLPCTLLATLRRDVSAWLIHGHSAALGRVQLLHSPAGVFRWDVVYMGGWCAEVKLCRWSSSGSRWAAP